eukprot:SAG22_NODE_4716_length_1182_cov_1.344414_2_plen_88_part_00
MNCTVPSAAAGGGSGGSGSEQDAGAATAAEAAEQEESAGLCSKQLSVVSAGIKEVQKGFGSRAKQKPGARADRDRPCQRPAWDGRTA